VNVKGFESKFGTSKGDMMETERSKVSVGLVTLDQLKQNKADLAKKEAVLEHELRKEKIQEEIREEEQRKKRVKEKTKKSVLSFGDEEDEENEEDEQPAPKKRVAKNPSVDTSFLPDRERELAEIEERKKLTHEWHAAQEKKKQEVTRPRNAPQPQQRAPATCTRRRGGPRVPLAGPASARRGADLPLTSARTSACSLSRSPFRTGTGPGTGGRSSARRGTRSGNSSSSRGSSCRLSSGSCGGWRATTCSTSRRT
jgi:hypothetical protein